MFNAVIARPLECRQEQTSAEPATLQSVGDRDSDLEPSLAGVGEAQVTHDPWINVGRNGDEPFLVRMVGRAQPLHESLGDAHAGREESGTARLR